MADVRRYNPSQERDPDGKFGDGVPGPQSAAFDEDGLDYVIDVESAFGEAMFGLDPAGDVRFAFRELRNGRNQNRELDLGLIEVEQLRDSLNEMVEARDELFADDGDLDPQDLHDDRAWGASDEHLVELYGNGQIVITIGHADDDPWQLRLDPPHEADPDDPEDEDYDDTQALLDGIDELWEAADREGFLVDEEDDERSRCPKSADSSPSP